MHARARGFTLVEMVVAIAISGVVMVFAGMFIVAPVDGFAAESRRATIVDEVAASWPGVDADLRHALPNSLRVRRNGAFVALEMLRVVDYSRYMSSPSTAQFNVAATLRDAVVGSDYTNAYLSVNNCGPGPPACPDAYTGAGSMSSLPRTIHITNAALGEQQLTVTPAAAFGLDSARRTIYFVSGPVTYLCDETQGTLRRYQNYPLAANQASWDSPGEFAAAVIPGRLMATGIAACDFQASATSATVPQTASLRLTATRASGESVTMFFSAGSGWLP